MNRSADLGPFLGATGILALLLMTTASAATIQAGPDLQAAINQAMPGDTVVAAPGTYGGLEITKSINLVGDGARSKRGIGRWGSGFRRKTPPSRASP